jgi:hypothetical protein
VEAIEGLDEFVIYRGNPHSGMEPPPGPPWLRTVLGDDFFADVTEAGVQDDAGMERLKHLSGLRCLSVGSHFDDGEPSRVTDIGFEHLGKLDQLQELDIGYTPISEAGLMHLSNLTGLRRLALFGTRISGVALDHIEKLTGLEQLYLFDIRITDGDPGTQGFATPEAVSHHGTEFTPADLLHLTRLPRLAYLQVCGDDLADGRWAHAALPYLAHVTTLTGLWVDGLNDADLKKLQAALPNCRINVPPGGTMAVGSSTSSPTSTPPPPTPDKRPARASPDQPGG